MRRARRGMARSGRAAMLLLVAMTLGGCSTWMPEGASPQAREINYLWNVLLVAGAAVYVLVQGLIIWAVIRYRKRDDELPRQTHGNNLLEITWTAIPLVMVTVLFVLSWQGIQTVNAQSDGDDVRLVRVEGFRWQWAFTYVGEEVPAPEPEGEDAAEDGADEEEPAGPEALRLQGTGDEGPEMVLPVDEPVRFELQSTDVIHSFFVPEFNYKLDVVPGITNSFEITPDRVGTFSGQCAEYCGLAHNDMHFTVRVVERSEFDAWLEGEKEAAAAGCEDETPGEISSENVSFDKDCLLAEADEVFELEYTNLENVPHNVWVYDGDNNSAPPLFEGETLTEEGSTTYEIGPLETGDYFFNCQIHPDSMTGTLVVR